MELKYLYTVRKIIETGSFQNAARALNYAQSTITFQVRQLEEELSVQLFEKHGNRMVLTEAGKEIVPLIDRVISACDELLYYNNTGRELRGSLRVALPETIVTYQLQPLLKQFKEKAPGVRLSLQVMNCYAIYDELVKGSIDIAIHYDVGKYPPNIVTEVLETYPVVMVSSPELADSQRDFVSPDQKKSVCHIQNDPDALYLKILHGYLNEKNITLETELELWSIEAIKRSVMSNLGVALLPRFTVEAELGAHLLDEIETEIKNGEITAVYAYHKNKWQSPAMKLFLDLLINKNRIKVSEDNYEKDVSSISVGQDNLIEIKK